jgi:hypothetical protein
VLLIGLDVDAVAGSNDLDWSTAALTSSDPLGDEEALPEGDGARPYERPA